MYKNIKIQNKNTKIKASRTVIIDMPCNFPARMAYPLQTLLYFKFIPFKIQ